MNISVCMTIFNGSKYLEAQIDSILNQLGLNGELLILDDCSTDGSWDLINSLYVNDYRVKLFKNENNCGVIKSFEKIISKANNEIVFLSDQDDIWMPDRVGKLIDLFEERNDVIGILNNALICDAQGENIGQHFFQTGHIKKFSIFHQFIKNDFIGCCLCFRRTALRKILPFPDNISMHDWWIGSVLISMGIVLYYPEPLVLYRRHGMNLSPSRRRGWINILKSRVLNFLALIVLLFRN